MPADILKQAQKIFMVGVAGIGMSGLARILSAQGKDVSGSDIADQVHREENLPQDCDLLIYSVAVPEDNPERKKAKELGIRQLSYPQAVGELSRDYEKVIAVAGTNGKTTTTAMIGWILEQAGGDPTVLVGSKVLAWNANARVGGKKYFVVEADEYRRAFLNYSGDVAVITNIEADHLDYFKDLEDVKKAFQEFAGKVKSGGKLIYNHHDANSESVARRFIGHKIPFQISRLRNGQADFRLQIPGRFNRANASAAASACQELGISAEVIRKALQSFTGTWRRFERIGKLGNAEVISDYAHHPSGIEATLQMVAEEFGQKKVLTVFQPHQRNRTKKLFKDFVRVFCESRLPDFIISEIFDVAGREEDKDKDISSRDLVLEVSRCGKKVQYAEDLLECERMVRNVLSNYQVIIFMGAGDIYKIASNLVRAV